MAIYHMHVNAFRRKEGRSATAAAAYRAGEKIVDERTGVEHDYTKKGGVLGATLLLPGGSTESRGDFWNRVEKHHRRGDAVTAREVEISLPAELDADQRHDLAMNFAQELADRYGVAVDVALHAPRSVSDRDLEKNPDQFHMTDPETGRRHNGNFHAHLLLSACHVDTDGQLGKKAVELDPIHCQRHKIENMTDRERGRWADMQNAALDAALAAASVDHRSYKDRGSDQEPTVHLGGYAARMRREGTPELSENATLNAEINSANDEVRKLLRKLSNERAEQHIGQKHQLQIRAELRLLYASQQRLDAAAEAAVEAEFQAWLDRPEVCSATGRLYPESALDAQIAREAAMPENQQAPKPAPKPAPEPTPEPAPEEPAVFNPTKYAHKIVLLETPAARDAALSAAARELELDEYDALLDALESLIHAGGELTDEGRQMHGDVVTPARASSTRAQRVPSEQIKGFGFPGGGPGL